MDPWDIEYVNHEHDFDVHDLIMQKTRTLERIDELLENLQRMTNDGLSKTSIISVEFELTKLKKILGGEMK